MHEASRNGDRDTEQIWMQDFMWLTPSLAAGRLECGWCEAVVLMPVGYGELLGGRRVELL